jgi:hypothetical protein
MLASSWKMRIALKIKEAASKTWKETFLLNSSAKRR